MDDLSNPEETPVTKIDRFKAHVERHKFAYGTGVGAVTTGVVLVVIKQCLGVTVISPINSDTVFVRPFALFSNQIVTVVQANRQGPPSWMIRCIETGEETTTQRAMAFLKGIDESDLSKHLNGKRDHVSNLHFKRLAIAA